MEGKIATDELGGALLDRVEEGPEIVSSRGSDDSRIEERVTELREKLGEAKGSCQPGYSTWGS